MADIGHNQPPTEFDEISKRVDELAGVANQWITERKVIETDDHEEKATDFLDQCLAEEKARKKAHRAEKDPNIAEGRAIDKKWKDLAAPLTVMIEKLRAMLKVRHDEKEVERQAEEKRLAEEAADALELAAAMGAQAESGEGDVIGDTVAAQEAQEDAEDAVAAAAAKTRERTQTKGAYGDKAHSTRKNHKAKITDHAKALAHYGNHDDVKAAVLRLANQDARASKGDYPTIPGVEFYSDDTFV